MDEINAMLDSIVLDLNKIADSSGIVKCILVSQIYEKTKELREKLKDDRLIFETEIQDLKEQLKSKQEDKGV